MAPNGFAAPVYGKPSLVFSGANATEMRTTADVVAIGTGSASSIFMLGSFHVWERWRPVYCREWQRRFAGLNRQFHG
jgi:hypothetical protein